MLTQELYDKSKRRAMLGQVQNAALDAVDETIQASVNASRYADAIENQNMRPPPPPSFSNAQPTGMQRTTSFPSNLNMGAPAPGNPSRGFGEGSWAAGFGGPASSRINIPSLTETSPF